MTVPNGVAGIRGTDFAVKVVQTSPGVFLVTFTSVTGQIQASATVTQAGGQYSVGQIVVKNLTTGQAWTPGPTCEAAISAAAINFVQEFQPPVLNVQVTPPPPNQYVPPSPTGGGGGGQGGNGGGTSPSD